MALSSGSEQRLKKWDLTKENYKAQCLVWPQVGKHILAHYDDQTVVVYQAYKPAIANYAVEHQRFGGPDFSFQRMSWVKTNFMWMMYRCGWAQKKDQERVLAIWLSRDGFEHILSLARSGKEGDATSRKGDEVRIQWDPDHDPKGVGLVRKAIQLGLRGKTLEEYSNRYIVNIKDITVFVLRQFKHVTKGGDSSKLMSPSERRFIPSSEATCAQIGLDR